MFPRIMKRALPAACFLVAATLLVASSLSPHAPVARVFAADGILAPVPGEPANLKWEGVASCGRQSTCHGDSGAQGARGTEVDNWTKNDKHAQAYFALEKERSKLIVRNYRNLANVTMAEATKDPVCLACHSMNVPAALQGMKFSLDEGVGCEVCHGPSENWREAHFRNGWSGKTDAEKLSLGMRPTRSLVGRSQRCVACHVGTGEANVDHDLIAAGHPQLKFEFNDYLSRMPKHWNADTERRRYPDLEARSWFIGQAVSAWASLNLLSQRAKTPTLTWPEFAEYDCFACHHDLNEPSWRQARGYQGRTPGALPWGSWYLSMPRLLAANGPVPDAGLAALVEQIQLEMSKPYPERERVSQSAATASAHIAKWLEKISDVPSYDPQTFRRTLIAILDDRTDAAHTSWYSARQIVLALAAAQLPTANRVLADKMALPEGSDSPPGFNPHLLDDELKAVRKMLNGEGSN